MHENLSACVGYAMHDDLLLHRKQDARGAEAQRAWQEHQRGRQRPSAREAVATALIGVATRIAPRFTTDTVATAP
jgi:hypothetical protein